MAMMHADLSSPYIFIQHVQPLVDGGLHPVKRRLGQSLDITCEVVKHGHDDLQVALQWRRQGARSWHEKPMTLINRGLDLWGSELLASELGLTDYRIVAWTDAYANWARDTRKKIEAAQDCASELLQGAALLSAAAARAGKTQGKDLAAIVARFQSLSGDGDRAALLLDPSTLAAAALHADRANSETGASQVYSLRVEPKAVEFATWYEVFPRSCSPVKGRSGTFQDVEAMLPYIHSLGFDALYFTPIHPIGQAKRKGRNNSLNAGPDDPGSPYAIGNIHVRHENGGGHFDVHPDLGTLADFDRLVQAASAIGMSVALDIALNCSPDHPYLKDHPDWFYRRPDGSIKYAENPPKKYEDIYPLNFECPDRENLWNEIRDIFLFWCRHGVRTFRVDNPHTKPVTFWQWCIAEVLKLFPDAIFLSEAFTRPRLMEILAKTGFQQSYGYFTWREHKQELVEYFEYLNQGQAREYMVCNVFPTTPDILPKHLQDAPPQMFKIRHALAALLSPVYGMYTGYELCENVCVGPRDELMDSEKYELKVRDYKSPHSIAPFIAKINQIRHSNPALQIQGNLSFHTINNDKLLFAIKRAPDNTLLIIVNLDPHYTQSGMLHVPTLQLGLDPHQSYHVHDLMTDAVYRWQGQANFVELHAGEHPCHIFRLF